MMDRVPILVVDYCRVRDKYPFLNELGSKMWPRPLLVLDGLYKHSKRYRAARGGTVTYIDAPPTIYRRRSWAGLFISRPRQECEKLVPLTDQLLRLHAEQDKRPSRYRASESIREAYEFTQRCLEQHKPSLMIVWNQFHPLSRAAQAAADACGIQTAFIEYGLLPGTLNFDFDGQMGESDVVRHRERFQALPLEESDLVTAESTLATLRSGHRNRRRQMPLGKKEAGLRARAAGRPIVLFAGHNDHASGTVPYDDHARHFHCPLFATSNEAANRLAELAEENGWFLLYKPHPFSSAEQRIGDNNAVSVIEDFDINECIDLADCVVTTVSQAGYIALVRGKPLVMLGYNQLRYSGAHYQVNRVDDLLPMLKAAIAGGLMPVQKEAFRLHVARLLKHYLYAMEGNAPKLTTARSAAQLAAIFEKAKPGEAGPSQGSQCG